MSPFVANLNLLRIREKLYEEKFVDLLSKERVIFYIHLIWIESSYFVIL